MLLGSLGASLLGNLLTEKWIVRADSGNKKGNEAIAKGQGQGIVTVGYGNEMDFQCRLIFNKLWNTKVLSEWTKI